MTQEQEIDRAERVGIMVREGGLSEKEAHQYCDTKPALYGIRERKEIQEGLL